MIRGYVLITKIKRVTKAAYLATVRQSTPKKYALAYYAGLYIYIYLYFVYIYIYMHIYTYVKFELMLGFPIFLMIYWNKSCLKWNESYDILIYLESFLTVNPGWGQFPRYTLPGK